MSRYLNSKARRAELVATRAERDQYRKLAETALNSAPPRLFIDAARTMAHAIINGVTTHIGMEAAKFIIAELGVDGDPHMASARHESKKTGATGPKDSNINSATCHDWKRPHDLMYEPGDGFFIVGRDVFSMHDRKKKPMPKWYDTKKPDYSMLYMSEDTVLALAAEINASRSMIAQTERYLERADERRRECHEGTDCQSGAKNAYHRVDDDHNIDCSQSSIHIGTADGHQSLNGSAVKHHRFVRMQIMGPDGLELVEIGMSFEQFAAALTGNGLVPCTVHSYWSRNADNVRLREVVRETPSVRKRLVARMNHRQTEQLAAIEEIVKELRETAATGKSLSKKKIEAVAADVERAAHMFGENAQFAVQQGVEEISAIVESAVIHLGQSYGVTPAVLQCLPEIGGALRELSSLPAPK